MATYGIVIGIRQYTDPAVPALDSPVEDALRMVAWLVNRGKVAPDKLIVLLNPVVTQVDDSMPHLDETLGQLNQTRDQFNLVLKRLNDLGNLRTAMKDDILQALVDVDDAAPNGGERLYFYYAGHGLASRIRFSNEDAIVPANYHKVLRKAIGVSTITRYFQSLKFPQQLLFLDCCRNLMLDEQELDSAPTPKPMDLTLRVPDQFVYNATAPGLKALDGRGLLTDALIDGLIGKGKAVDWVGGQKCYAVRAVKLFDYISSRYATRPEPAVVDQVDGKNQIQEPRLGGEHNLEPVVVTLPEADIPPVTLTLSIDPKDAHPIRQVNLISSGVKHEYQNVAETPLTIQLKPRTYFLEVEVGDRWLPGGDPGPWTLEVFDPQDYSVSFSPNDEDPAVAVVTPAEPGPEATPPTAVTAVPEPPGRLMAAAAPMTEGGPPEPRGPSAGAAPAEAGPGHLVVTADDPLAVIEVVAASGAPVAGPDGRPLLGVSPLDCPALEAGLYHARLKTPRGPVGERLVEVIAGKDVAVSLVTPTPDRSPVVQALRDRFDRPAGGDGPAGMGGGSASVESFGLPREATPAGPGAPGVVVTLAVEVPTAEGVAAGGLSVAAPEQIRAYLRSIAIQCWPFGEAPRPARTAEPTSDPGIARVAFPAEPGPRWLWASSALKHAAFALPGIEGRVVDVVLHQAADGQIHAFMALPSCRAGSPADPEALHRLDRAQQFLLNGQLREVAATIEPLMARDDLDPIAGCIAGHLLIRERDLARLDALADRMIGQFPELPDSHVLRGFHREASGRSDEAAAGYRDALDRGLPVSAPLFQRLAEGVARGQVAHPRVATLEQVAARLVAGGLWTAWTPDPDWTDAPNNPPHSGT